MTEVVQSTQPIKTDKERAAEFSDLRMQLQDHHAIFYALWEMAVPIFTKEIPTSCIAFSPEDGGLIQFEWNPDLWDSLDVYNRAFICCHEALHVLLEHGRRIKGTKVPRLVNQALDVVVNHTLVDFFDFDRSLITNEEELCWIDTVFENSEDLNGKEIETQREFEYYFGKIKEIVQDQVEKGIQDGSLGIGSGSPVDGHDDLSEILDQDIADKITEHLKESLSDEEKEDVNNALGENKKESGDEEKEQGAGTIAGNACYVIPPELVKKSYKWTDVIKYWRKRRQPDMPMVETWANKSRRHTCLSPDLFLPSEREDFEASVKKSYIDVFVFMDTSGSCIDLKEDFLKCCRSFPEDVFKVRGFCFDTRVYDMDISKGELFGFGGTAFSPIEEKLQNLLKTKQIEKYPDAVFLFTDGDAYDSLSPQYPDRWHWFLGGYYKTTRVVPKASHIHDLEDYT